MGGTQTSLGCEKGCEDTCTGDWQCIRLVLNHKLSAEMVLGPKLILHLMHQVMGYA